MSKSYFIINTAIANVYHDGDFNSPVMTQALLGETCLVLDEEEKWVRIRQWDDYEGWVNKAQGVFDSLPYTPTLRFLDLQGKIYSSGILALRSITFGGQIKSEGKTITLPDGTKGHLLGNLGYFNSRPTRESILKTAYRFLGSPYIWGGKTPAGFDCSGLVQTVFSANGLSLKRDARIQHTMEELTTIDFAETEPGDLIFFGDKTITHVGISTGGFGFIHSQGWVKLDTLNPDYKCANFGLIEKIHSVKSINGFLTQHA